MQQRTSVASTFTIVNGVWRVLARPVLLRASALCIALGIPAFVLSAGNGLRAVDVIAWLHRSLLTRCLLWTGWLVLSAPALRAVFVAPGALSLRALRLPRAVMLLALFALCAASQVPWLVLFARGAGWVEAWGALAASVTLGASAVSVGGRLRGSVALTIALGVSFIVWDPTPRAAAVLFTLCAPLALRAAQRDALEQPGSRFKLTRPGSALRALYSAHLLRLLRLERSRLSVAFCAAAAGSTGTLLSLRNDPSPRPLQRALIVMALPLIVAAAVCVAPLLENEGRLHALLRSLRVPRLAIVFAFLLAVATPSSALAATSSVIISANAQPALSSLSLVLLSWAVALGCAVALWGRFLEQRAQRGTGKFVAGVTVLALLATIGASAW